MRAAAQHQVAVFVAGQIDGRATLAGIGDLHARAFTQRQFVVAAEGQARTFELQRVGAQLDVAAAGRRGR